VVVFDITMSQGRPLLEVESRELAVLRAVVSSLWLRNPAGAFHEVLVTMFYFLINLKRNPNFGKRTQNTRKYKANVLLTAAVAGVLADISVPVLIDALKLSRASGIPIEKLAGESFQE
jgi:hypothetical protein